MLPAPIHRRDAADARRHITEMTVRQLHRLISAAMGQR